MAWISMDMDNEPIVNLQDYLCIPTNKVGAEMDEFWVKLGIETCNLYIWSENCKDIVNRVFGKTKSKIFQSLEDKWIILRSLLDIIVCNNYPRNVYSIQYENREIQITHIFYTIGTMVNLPVYRCEKRIDLTFEDEKYIIDFTERMNKYLTFLEENVEQLPIHAEEKEKSLHSKMLFDGTPKSIKSQIKKIKRTNYHDKILQMIQLNQRVNYLNAHS